MRSKKVSGRARAFTLIELLIVIAIIAILAAILIPNFLHARAMSQTSACEGNEKELSVAMEEYAVDHGGTYPADFGANALTTPYLNFTPIDPASGLSYIMINATNSVYGSYEIVDQGGHDSTTTTGLHVSGAVGTLCTSCTSVLYFQSGGIYGN
jgi:prepilin-type N-terminal cleavage/methylation domain-containing protein